MSKGKVKRLETKFYVEDGSVYSYKDVSKFLKEVKDNGYEIVKKYKKKKVTEYINVPCAFDIETTSFEYNEHKSGIMYIWMFGINGISIYGRTWEEYVDLVERLNKLFKLSDERKLVCFIHNLSYEFQFMRKYFKWDDVFSLDLRRPAYALANNIEYRCSYILTGCSLEKVGDDLLKYKVSKLVGDLDYSKPRHYKTEITETELGYCINDIRVVMCKIKECIEKEGNVANIPLTKTGYVRRDVRKAVQKSTKDYNFIRDLHLDVDEYNMLVRAFRGGFTHANLYYSGVTVEDVVSYDFTSSYPAVMLSEQYPMSNGKKVKIESYEQFMEYLRTHCCLFDIVMTNVKLKKDMGDAPLSSSGCFIKGNKTIDNGRIRKADELMTTITEEDFFILRKFYSFDYSVDEMIVYEKGYLPKPIIEKVLEYYNSKTTLKDVEGREEDYMIGKSNLNSIFGMMVMLIIRDQIVYNEEWDKDEPNAIEELQKYNDSWNRFTWFPWGVWITAYARKNLFTGIYECGVEDYIYSDTDSIKILNASEHEDYIALYNRQITEKLEACLDHYKLNKDLINPKTCKGTAKPLGVWDFDGHYSRFKTLGAKRYMVEHDNEWIEGQRKKGNDTNPIATTIAGVSKKAGKKYFATKDNPFEEFNEGLTIKAEETGKMTHIYCDDEITFEMTDYNGVTELVTTKSGISLEPAPFTLSLAQDYRTLLSYIEMGCEDIEFK